MSSYAYFHHDRTATLSVIPNISEGATKGESSLEQLHHFYDQINIIIIMILYWHAYKQSDLMMKPCPRHQCSPGAGLGLLGLSTNPDMIIWYNTLPCNLLDCFQRNPCECSTCAQIEMYYSNAAPCLMRNIIFKRSFSHG